MRNPATGFLGRQISLVVCVLSVLQSQACVFAKSHPVTVFQQLEAVSPIPILTPAQLDSLVSPIALYPDPLLSQVLAASTYPLEIVEAAQWLDQNSTLSAAALEDAAKQQDWDSSVQALILFPDVLHQLSQNIRWTTDLGNSFLAQQVGVMDAVQRLRSQAVSSGNLISSAQTVVTSQPQGATTIVEIQPANSQIIYVPVYDPIEVWGPSFYSYPIIYYPRRPIIVGPRRVSFSNAVYVGSFFAGWSGWDGWGWRPNWSGRTVVVNNNFFNRYGYGRNTIVSNPRDGWTPWQPDQVRRRHVRPPVGFVESRPRNDVGRAPVNQPPTYAQPPRQEATPRPVFNPRPGPNVSNPTPRAFDPPRQMPEVSRPAPDTPRPNRPAPAQIARPNPVNQGRVLPGETSPSSQQGEARPSRTPDAERSPEPHALRGRGNEVRVEPRPQTQTEARPEARPEGRSEGRPDGRYLGRGNRTR